MLIIAYAMLFKSYDFLFVILFSALHELGHLIALLICKGKPDRLVFAYYGIGLKHSSDFNAFRELIFLSAGIVVNLFFYIFNIKRDINLALLIVNALPIYPLDGGRILKIILNKFFNLTISDMIFKAISVFIIILLIITALYLKSVSLGFITLYVIVYSINNSFN